MRLNRGWAVLAAVLVLALASSGCAARWAYRQGKRDANKGNWDAAVARLTKASRKSPRNIGYKLALENARIQASRLHIREAKKHLAADDLDKAADEMAIAANYDPANKSASDDLAIIRSRIRKREEEKQRLADFEAAKARAQVARIPFPVLSARSPVPITLKFTDTSLEKILETLGKLSGVNILFDPDYKDKRFGVNLTGVTFQDALDQITFVNKLFYKVVDQNTLIVISDTPTNRRRYDEQLVRTFYLRNADAKDVQAIVKTITGIQKVANNDALGAITVVGTPDELAFAEKVIENNDKSKGEVMVEVEIIAINRIKAKEYGINISSYSVSSTLSPTGSTNELGKTDSGEQYLSERAHLLSSLNLADFIVQIPSSVRARLFEDESLARLLASPRLRAAEGKKTELRIGTEVAIPVTTFTMPQAGQQSTYGPATSFNTRNVGVNLAFTPKINAGGDILLDPLVVEFSTLGSPRTVTQGLTINDVDTRSVNGTLRVRDGETTLLGGLISRIETEGHKSPIVGLKEIPLLGGIFGDTTQKSEDTEILISLTPHIVRAPKIVDNDLVPLSIGTTDAKRVRGARPLFGAAEVLGPAVAPPAATAPGPSPSPGRPQTGPAPATPPPPAAPPGPPAPQSTVFVPSPAPSAELATPTVQVAPSPAPSPVATPTPEPALTPTELPLAARFIPTSLSLKTGETGVFDLLLINGRDLLAIDAVLSFDASTIAVMDVNPGALLSMDGVQVSIDRQIDNGRARVRFTRGKAMSGSGAVVTLSVKGLRPGVGVVNVESLAVSTAAGPRTPTAILPGQVTVAP